jgi:hypothetical protein
MKPVAAITRQAAAPIAHPIVPPIALVDASPDSQLAVREMTIRGRTDRRTAELALIVDPGDGDARAVTAKIVVAMPVLLAGAESALYPLLVGRVEQVQHSLGAPRTVRLLVADCWGRALRSVLQQTTDTPTVRSALDALNDAGGLALRDSHLNDRILEAPSRVRLSAGREVGDALESLLDRHGLHIRRELVWAGGTVTDRRSVVPDAHGRTLTLSERQVGALRHDGRACHPVQLVARADGAVVESTFVLTGAWPIGEEGLPDQAYAKSSSSDFDAVADVYRRWVLNEDGAFGAPRHDLTGLFADGRAVPPVPTPFGPTLTADAFGQSLGVVVEYATDGQAWSRYPGRIVVFPDRAGVYLDDDALPGSFLAAAKAGTLTVRVTATVRSPLPLEQVRWVGNPFAGPFARHDVSLGETFTWQRVASASRYHDDVAAGTRAAAVSDDRNRMAAWLATQPAHRASDLPGFTLETTCPLPGLRIGDRINLPGQARPCRVVRICHRWTHGNTTVVLTPATDIRQ